VPLVGTIAVVTFVASYVPIIGAWTAGFFVFALALADQGTSTAFLMALVVFLANGPLQQIVQPIAYGATLEVNPLVVFVVTIAAGTLFGMVGLVLGAPLVSAGVHISADLRKAEAPEVAPPEPAPEAV
jgi:predicted PurR-regulated permease PerM